VAYPVKNGIVSLIHPQERHAVLQEERAWRIREVARGRYEALQQALGASQEPRYRTLLEWLKELLCSQGPARVLELGAGRGWASRALAQDGHQVVASDILADCEIGLGCAVRQGNDVGPGVAHVQCRAEALPFRDESFDCIFCFATLRHIADLERVLREVSRVLKPGGIFLALDEPFRGILTTATQRLQDCVSHRLARTWLVGTLPSTVRPETMVLRASLGATLHEAARRVPFCVSLGAAAGLQTSIFPADVVTSCPTLVHLLEEPASSPSSWLDSFAAAFALNSEQLRECCAQAESELPRQLLDYWSHVGNIDGVLIAEKRIPNPHGGQAEADGHARNYRRLDSTLLQCSCDGIVPIYGVYPAEENRGRRFRWIQPQAGFLIATADAVELTITCPPKRFRSEPVRVEIRIEDEQAPLLVTLVFPGKTVRARAPLRGRPSPRSSLFVRLSANIAFIPSDYSPQRCQDTRLLSLQIGGEG
jgi:ubiquinone/menaquinone biosynthesis C-methylase UbiE